jgi:lipoic acid synthetase
VDPIPLPVHPGPRRRLPGWLRKRLPTGAALTATAAIVERSGVATVCQDAHCPNLGECWSRRTATFMILGDRCTRRCHYCAVTTARPAPPAGDEPERLAEACAALGLRHVVITAVARDDLDDEGAGHFVRCVEAVRSRCRTATIEVLPADFHARPDCIAMLCAARPDVYNHNIETVDRLTPIVRPQAKYRRSLEVLRIVKEHSPGMVTKSGLMVGLGETRDEILATFADLRGVGCEMLTVGQYLQPSPKHTPVARYYPPEEFDDLAEQARRMGFHQVASGPFVRSSYHAAEDFDAMAASG